MPRLTGWAPALLPSRGSEIRRQGFGMKWDLPVKTDRVRVFFAEDDLKDTMDASTFERFICAVLSGSNTIMPSEWLRWVWDQRKESPEFASEKQ
jgi:hypothetical protein